MISLIAAVAKNGVIGISGKIPWHLPADFLYFKETTIGCPIIMGKTTFTSIGRALPGRKNIVLSRGDDVYENVTVVASLPEAIALAEQYKTDIFIIGGASVYVQAFARADRLYITEVESTPEGDTFFPTIDKKIWMETSRNIRMADGENTHNMNFVIYDRRK